MHTYSLIRIDTNGSPLLGFVRALTPETALQELRPTIREQQVGTIMELRAAHKPTITISNDVDHIYRYPDGTTEAVVIWSRPGTQPAAQLPDRAAT